MKTFDDYYSYEWSVLKEKDVSSKKKLVFVGALSGLMAVLLIGGWMVNKAVGDSSLVLFVLMSGFGIASILVLGFFWIQVMYQDGGVLRLGGIVTKRSPIVPIVGCNYTINRNGWRGWS